ncbi:unnamed protein product [Rotaria sp. Silwood2]|nr:unnamed protein product [Rotaria sp. Silwood2]CAF4123941.1 unnamed protein product [Rotaria sp. Silwood2]
MAEIELDGFNDWHQYLINAYYKYCSDRCILPQVGNDQRIILKGPISSIQEAKQKYKLTVALIQEKIRLQQSLLERSWSMSTLPCPTSALMSTAESSTCYNVMLSYCQEDSVACHHLANRLIDEGFSLWLCSNGVNDHSDTLSQMKKSNSIILCISEHYFEDEHCEIEAKYASQLRKQIIPIKIQNCTPVDWLQQLIVNNFYFPMFGSENHFDLVFDKLLLEILQYTSPGDISVNQQASDRTTTTAQNQVTLHGGKVTKLHTPLTIEQRKLIYQMNVEHLIGLQKAELVEDEKKIAIEKVEDIIREAENQYKQDAENNQHEQYSSSTYNSEYERRQNEIEQQIYLDTGILSYRRWLKQASNLKTKQNIAPFTVSGDINDASFPMLNEVLQKPNLSLRSYTKHSSLWSTNCPTRNLWYGGYSGPSLQLYYWHGGGSVFCSVDNSIAKLYRAMHCRSWGMSTEEEIRQRQKMIDSNNMMKRRKEIGKYFTNNYKYVTEESLKSYLEFAQRMKHNANELARLSEMSTSSMREQPKQQIQASLTAIFSLYTESQAQEASIATSKIQIPSKFSRKSNCNSNAQSKMYNRACVLQIIL